MNQENNLETEEQREMQEDPGMTLVDFCFGYLHHEIEAEVTLFGVFVRSDFRYLKDWEIETRIKSPTFAEFLGANIEYLSEI